MSPSSGDKVASRGTDSLPDGSSDLEKGSENAAAVSTKELAGDSVNDTARGDGVAVMTLPAEAEPSGGDAAGTSTSLKPSTAS